MKFQCIKTVFIVALATAICFTVIKKYDKNVAKVDSENYLRRKPVIILDAGHGGEDGGAVASDGTNEKDINLAITKDISALFEVFAINYVAVRTEDVSVGDNDLPTLRERKRSDIKNREELVNSTPEAVFLSIHQNMYDAAKYRGTQVFYGAQNPNSEILAQEIQDAVKNRLQPDNTRRIKPSGDNIYLLYNAKAPSVMVECGFLSNPEELALLKDDNYRKQISYSIFCGLQSYLNKISM